MQKTKSDRPARKIKKRFIMLNLAALLLILIAVNYVDYAGDEYEMKTFYYGIEVIPDDVEICPDNTNVVELADWYVDDDSQLILNLRSIEPGETDMTFRITESDGAVYDGTKTHISVNGMGTIIETRNGMINFSGFKAVLYLFLCYLALALFVMLYSFIDCARKSEYSYRMIAYGGTATFLSVMLTILIYKLCNNVVDNVSNLISLLLGTAEWFLGLMFLPMAIAAIAVSISNIRLMQREGFRPVNALGIVFSVLWLLGLIVVFWMSTINLFVFNSYEEYLMANNTLRFIRYFFAYVLAYMESMLIATVASAVMASRHTPPYDRDYIIILGCAIRGDGSLTPLLKGRADSAMAFERRQYEATGKHARFVPSGGQGSDEVISEGEAMERYLLSCGVDQEQILREDKSVNTDENMKLSAAVIARDIAAEQEKAHADGGAFSGHGTEPVSLSDKKIAFATTNYHVFRGYILSKRNGFDAQGISAKTKWYFFPNAFLREFIGLLYGQKIRHIVMLVLMAALSLLAI